MLPILVGLETEYGLTVEGRGATEQVDDAMALVRGYPGERFVGWDYRHESPRADLRGFQADRLNIDPEDAKFDAGHARSGDQEVRSDCVLPNGARLYNDHGHPEYSTPECWSVEELAMQDAAGDLAVLSAAQALEERSGLAVHVYKNNTDGHGASYGTHESYLAPRAWGFERLYRCVCPVLIARQVVCGSGKVGAESGTHCDFQISQRADFFTDAYSIDTLYRRPVFNTRDEPHADPSKWIRLHVICGDANRLSTATQRKVALIKLALWLEEAGRTPVWRVSDPAAAFKAVSRDLTCEGRIGLEGSSWTTSRQVLESYVEAAERFLDSSVSTVCEALAHGRESLELLDDLGKGGDRFARTVDWAAKQRMLTEYLDSEGTDWGDPALKAYDLAYHELDPANSLFAALEELGLVESGPTPEEASSRLALPAENTRALARSVAVSRFREDLVGVSWGNLSFETPSGRRSAVLPPDVEYSRGLIEAESLDEFLGELEALT